MNIGRLYAVKQWFWLLFPTKDTATAADAAVSTTGESAVPAAAAAAYAAAYADYWSKHYNCEVNYFSPDSIVVFLEEDGKYKKVLTSDGRIGWTWFSETYNECFEEMKA